MKITDDLGTKIHIEREPQSIVSLVPSITLTLADMGLGSRLTGVTKFCKYPEQVVKTVAKIGGPKNIDINKILNINPDIVFAVKEENEKEQVLELSKHMPVVVFDISNPDDAFRMMRTMGLIFNIEKKADELVQQVAKAIKEFPLQGNQTKVVYLIWKKPWMAAGKETYIGSMLHAAGYDNIVSGRYPQISRLQMANADTILLATEPYHFKEADRQELQQIFPGKNIEIVNGELFTWYGTYLLGSYASNKTKIK